MQNLMILTFALLIASCNPLKAMQAQESVAYTQNVKNSTEAILQFHARNQFTQRMHTDKDYYKRIDHISKDIVAFITKHGSSLINDDNELRLTPMIDSYIKDQGYETQLGKMACGYLRYTSQEALCKYAQEMASKRAERDTRLDLGNTFFHDPQEYLRLALNNTRIKRSNRAFIATAPIAMEDIELKFSDACEEKSEEKSDDTAMAIAI